MNKYEKAERKRIFSELKKCIGHASFIRKIKELEEESSKGNKGVSK